MQIQTIYRSLLLLFCISILGCKSSAAGADNPKTVEEAEKQLAKQKKKQAQINERAKQAAYDRFWSMQSKQAKESIKRNNKRLKKLAKNRKKGYY